MDDVGERIKKLRKERNMSVDELAEKIGKNRATIYRYEKNNIENVPYTALIPIAKALNTTPAYLMGWDDEVEVTTKDNLKLLCDMLDKYKLSIDSFTDDEIEKIAEYALFLISKRKE